MLNHPYCQRVYEGLQAKWGHQKEYLQAVHEFFQAIEVVLQQDNQWEAEAILERLVLPERIVSFRVPWQDDQGHIQLNWGYRVQHSSLLGPYKGGLRFDPSVNESILKFLAFEQSFKNALTGLPLGGAKGGADFSPVNRSDHEIMRFCQSFMTELAKHISQDLDVPAGDIGVGKREIGYLFGQYKRLKGVELGVLTGKPIIANGLPGREEATGYGLLYFTQALLAEDGESLTNQRVIISGTGNVGFHALKKATELGARVVAISNIGGSIYDPQGIQWQSLIDVNNDLNAYCHRHPQAQFSLDSVWSRAIPADIALPCATQNEINADQARNIIQQGVRYLVEGANMPSDATAIQVFNQDPAFIWAPGKAANAGGVAVSSLEMSQNAMRDVWMFEEVDQRLQTIMQTIFDTCKTTCDLYGLGKNYAAGADIAAFIKLANSVKMQGLI